MQKNIDKNNEFPLVPLSINVLPGAFLPLQIFEPRYIDMVKDCLSAEKGFCVVLSEHSEIKVNLQDLPQHVATGTYVEVVDFNQLENGLLGLTVQGRHRMQVLERRLKEDGLLIGEVVEIPEPDSSSLERDFSNIWRVLKEISNHPEIKKLDLEIDFSNSSSVAYHLASLLPVTPKEKQEILELDSNKERLENLESIIKRLGG